MYPSAPSVTIEDVPSPVSPSLIGIVTAADGNGDGGAIAVCLSDPCRWRRTLLWMNIVEGNGGLRLGTFDLF